MRRETSDWEDRLHPRPDEYFSCSRWIGKGLLFTARALLSSSGGGAQPVAAGSRCDLRAGAARRRRFCRWRSMVVVLRRPGLRRLLPHIRPVR